MSYPRPCVLSSCETNVVQTIVYEHAATFINECVLLCTHGLLMCSDEYASVCLFMGLHKECRYTFLATSMSRDYSSTQLGSGNCQVGEHARTGTKGFRELHQDLLFQPLARIERQHCHEARCHTGSDTWQFGLQILWVIIFTEISRARASAQAAFQPPSFNTILCA